ncbi:hypothetical protein C9939_03855, partial [Pseudidiomarina aestuarii]
MVLKTDHAEEVLNVLSFFKELNPKDINSSVATVLGQDICNRKCDPYVFVEIYNEKIRNFRDVVVYFEDEYTNERIRNNAIAVSDKLSMFFDLKVLNRKWSDHVNAFVTHESEIKIESVSPGLKRVIPILVLEDEIQDIKSKIDQVLFDSIKESSLPLFVKSSILLGMKRLNLLVELQNVFGVSSFVDVMYSLYKDMRMYETVYPDASKGLWVDVKEAIVKYAQTVKKMNDGIDD